MSSRFVLSSEQEQRREEFKAFVNEYIEPTAHRTDAEQELSEKVIKDIIAQGYWGTEISNDFGGSGYDMMTYGLFSEEVGRGCSNVRNLLGV